MLRTGLGGRRRPVRAHDPLSRRASLAYGNGTTQSYSYSKAGDLETHTHTLSGTSNTWTNSYTKAHQLLSEAASNAAWVFQLAVNETTSYGSANNLNQYVTVTHAANPTATLYYDGNGNLIDDGAWDFEYDAENRLTKASNATTGTTAQYLYDPMGRRQAKIVGSVTTSFLSDGAEEIAEHDGAGGLLRRYIPGPGTDQPIAMVTPSGGTHQHSYFHTNRQGSTVAMSNDAGTVSEGPYTYDAYGQGAPSTGVPFKYTGRRLDPETGLYYYRARYYSAALGRFLQTDPIGYADQMNLYGYVNNDPENATDPSGEYGRGSGWKDDKDWEKFNKAQKKAATDMRKSAKKLRDRSRSTRMPGQKAKLKGMADGLDKGASFLENDGSDGKTLAHLVSEDWMETMGAPGSAAFVPENSPTMSVNRDHWSWKDNSDAGDFVRRWAYGHESLHSAGFKDLKLGKDRAYRLAPKGSPNRRAYEHVATMPEGWKTPDYMMCEVYCDQLDTNW